MIELTIGTLVNSTEVLQKLANAELKAKLAWEVSRMLKAAETEIQGFNDARLKVINKFGTKDENGELITDENGNCRIDPAHMNEFTEEMNELLQGTVEINANKLDINALDNVNFTPSDMARLEPFVDFGE